MIDKKVESIDKTYSLNKDSVLANFCNKLKFLASIAEPENWCYDDFVYGEKHPEFHPVGILYQYIHHTYSKAKQDGLLVVANDYMAMNTGLLTPNAEQIFMLFQKNTTSALPQEWYFLTFYQESNAAIPVSLRHVLPPHVDYFDDNPQDMYFDPKLKIDVNIDHIINDNYDRLPLSLKTFERSMLVDLVASLIEGMKKRILRNNRLIVYQYYKSRIMYLAPMKFGSDIIPLGIEKNDKTYRINTILTLGMAYCNARLLMRPESNWLINK